MNGSSSALNRSDDFNSCQSLIIGFSENRTPLNVVFFGGAGSPLRVFLMAGQHGDEKYGRMAAARLFESFKNGFDAHFPSVRLAVLQNSNPDGSSRKSRYNSAGIDLNRDHQRLDGEETNAIHSFVRSWKPHLIIDAHNYPSRRKHLLLKNLIIDYDVFIDIPTNPAVSLPLDKNGLDEFVQTIRFDLESLGHSCRRYTIVKPSGKVRHSTPDVVDARNSLSLRYGALTVLLEGRNPRPDEGKAGTERIVSAQLRAMVSILRWARNNKSLLVNQDRDRALENERIPVRSRYVLSDRPIQMSFLNAATGKPESVSFNKYAPSLETTNNVQLPSAYAVPLEKAGVIRILRRHGFSFQFSDQSKLALVECYLIQTAVQSKRQNRPPRKISTIVKTEKRRLDKYLIFPATQEGSRVLSVFLEPESKYGLHRYPDLNLKIQPGTSYPILRVLE